MKEKIHKVYVIERAEYQLLVAARVPLCEVYTGDVLSFLFTFKGQLPVFPVSGIASQNAPQNLPFAKQNQLFANQFYFYIKINVKQSTIETNGKNENGNIVSSLSPPFPLTCSFDLQ